MRHRISAHLVDREPNGWQGDKPKQEEAHEVPCGRARRFRQVIRYSSVIHKEILETCREQAYEYY
jgi:hypothetical protein